MWLLLMLLRIWTASRGGLPAAAAAASASRQRQTLRDVFFLCIRPVTSRTKLQSDCLSIRRRRLIF